MIIVDTNAVSELMRPVPDRRVQRWFDLQRKSDLYLTTTTLAELLSGLGSMPAGQRRDGYQQFLERLRTKWFAGRLLPFTEEAAERYGALASGARRLGRTISIADGQIAAVAAVRGMIVATRDTGPFEAAGLAVINPWSERLG